MTKSTNLPGTLVNPSFKGDLFCVKKHVNSVMLYIKNELSKAVVAWYFDERFKNTS